MELQSLVDEIVSKSMTVTKKAPLEMKLMGLLDEYGFVEFYDRLIQILDYQSRHAKDPSDRILLDGLGLYAEKSLMASEALSDGFVWRD